MRTSCGAADTCTLDEASVTFLPKNFFCSLALSSISIISIVAPGNANKSSTRSINCSNIKCVSAQSSLLFDIAFIFCSSLLLSFEMSTSQLLPLVNAVSNVGKRVGAQHMAKFCNKKTDQIFRMFQPKPHLGIHAGKLGHIGEQFQKTK